MSELKFLDPACGCGNFYITYRESSLLELEIYVLLIKTDKAF
ncbi:MAG: DNA methyltransferase [Cloacibacterium normanense]